MTASESRVKRARATMKRLGLKGFNKPKRTPGHPKKSHMVMAKMVHWSN